MVDIAGTLTAVSTAIGLAKDLRGIEESLGNAEAKLKIADLTATLAEAKLGLVDALSAVKVQEQEISELREKLEYKQDNTVRLFGFHYEDDGTGKPLGTPFCPVCLDGGTFMHVILDRTLPGHTFTCPKCHANVGHAERFSFVRPQDSSST